MKEIAIYIACGVLSYLIGSINTSLVLSNGLMKKDIRNYGSGNAGTTNMMRVFGWQFGLITFIIDVAKGFVCVYLSKKYGGEIGAFIASVAVVTGHNWPVYYGFRGGKGVATTFGVLLVWQTLPTIAVFVLCVLMILITRIVSIASICGCIISIIVVYILYPSDSHILHRIIVTVLSLFSLFQHRSNIKRIIEGKENKLSFRSSAYIIKDAKKTGDDNDKA